MKKIIAFLAAIMFVFCACGENLPTDNSQGESVSSQNHAAVSDTDYTSSQESSDPVQSMDEETTSAETSSAETSSGNTTSDNTSSNQTSSGGGGSDKPYVVNGVIIHGTRAIEQYGGGVQSAANFAGYMNSFSQALGEGIKLYSMPIPTSSYYYAPDGYKGSITNHEKTFQSLRDNLNSNVTDINLLPVLQPYVDKEIYFRTEHHWTALGAYYSAKAFAESAGVPFDDISTYTEKFFEGFVGSYYSTYTKDPVLKNNPERLYYYLTPRSYVCYFYNRSNFTNQQKGTLVNENNKSYSMFAGGDSYAVKVETGLNTGRKLLLIKDSFGIAMIPFLVGSFDEIYAIDPRYCNLNAATFAKEHGITDVCVALSSFGTVGSSGKKIASYK